MSKKFRPWQVDDVLLLPPSVTDFVPAGHFSHFVRDLVREQLDLSAITGDYAEARGYPPYDPRMMTALLLYAYCQGVYSSRRMAPIWADRAAAKPFSGERDTLDLRGNRRHPLKGNRRRSVRQRLHEISALGACPSNRIF